MRRPRFDSRLFCVEFTFEKVAEGQDILPVLWFPSFTITAPNLHTHLHLAITLTASTNGTARRIDTEVNLKPSDYTPTQSIKLTPKKQAIKCKFWETPPTFSAQFNSRRDIRVWYPMSNPYCLSKVKLPLKHWDILSNTILQSLLQNIMT
jgi:hypothetical protein